MPLQASPAGLLGRFAPSSFALPFSAALLPQASCFALALSVPLLLRASRSRKFSKKISVSQSSRNVLKRIEMKKKFTPLTRNALRASGEAQTYLLDFTPRIPRSVHAKFHTDCTKIVGARGIHTDTHTDRQSFYHID